MRTRAAAPPARRLREARLDRLSPWAALASLAAALAATLRAETRPACAGAATTLEEDATLLDATFIVVVVR